MATGSSIYGEMKSCVDRVTDLENALDEIEIGHARTILQDELSKERVALQRMRDQSFVAVKAPVYRMLESYPTAKVMVELLTAAVNGKYNMRFSQISLADLPNEVKDRAQKMLLPATTPEKAEALAEEILWAVYSILQEVRGTKP